MASNMSSEFNATIAKLRGKRSAVGLVRAKLRELDESLVGSAERRKRTLTVAAIVMGPIALGLLGVGVWALIPRPVPNYQTGRIDRLMSFTLLSDEFNSLSVDQRLKLIGTLRERIEGMSAGESVLLAAFAGGVVGKAREQIEENASRLAIDLWDKFATDYERVPASDREQYLDQAAIDFFKSLETVGGEVRNISDNERLAEMREGATEGAAQMRQGRGPSGRAFGRMYDVMLNDVGSHASPGQKMRGGMMLLQMSRRLRGEDIDTGKPKGGG